MATYIVTIACEPAALEARLAAVPGARFIRELPPDRVVVALDDAKATARLAALPGVESVVEDRLEHPTGRPSTA
jgi:hypothetical protein